MTAMSVVVPLYNKEGEVGRALNSVLGQTVSDFEVIVVDDGSTDGGPAVVEALGDGRVRLIRQECGGVSAARNRGAAEASSDLVAFLDADDEWRPTFLETVLRLRERFPDCAVFATSYFVGSPDGSTRNAVLNGLPRDFREGALDDYFGLSLVSEPLFNGSSVAVDREALQRVGGFPEYVGAGEDLLTWARLAVSSRIAFCVEPLSTYWEPGRRGRAIRTPEGSDPVARHLRTLFTERGGVRKRKYRRYLAHWHAIRASTYLTHDKGRQALGQSLKALRLNPGSMKLWVFALVALCPPPWREGLWGKLRSFSGRT